MKWFANNADALLIVSMVYVINIEKNIVFISQAQNKYVFDEIQSMLKDQQLWIKEQFNAQERLRWYELYKWIMGLWFLIEQLYKIVPWQGKKLADDDTKNVVKSTQKLLL